MHGSGGSRPASRRLVVSRARDAQREWMAEARRESQEFLARRGHLLADPSLATWVLEQCAELIGETAEAAPAWGALPLEEVWRRLDNLQRFFPQPRLVVAHHETLRAFVPWLCGRGLLTIVAGEDMLTLLERVSAQALRRARDELARRRLAAGGRGGR
jgi:hypothetical protein